MSTQNIINICFAISITLLIYQNTQLNAKIADLTNPPKSELETCIEAKVGSPNPLTGGLTTKEEATDSCDFLLNW